MKLSICMLAYNQEQFIVEAMDSALSQKTNFPFEIVIGVDASTDSTLQVVSSYASKHKNIKVIQRPKRVGYPYNFLDTIKQCNSEYVAFLDGDDKMLPGKLQTQMNYLENHSDVVLVGHAMRTFSSESNKTLGLKTAPIKKNSYYIEDFLKHGSIFPNSSKIFRRNSFPEYFTHYSIHCIADYFITLHILKNQKAAFIPEVLGEYRIHKDSLMSNVKGKEIFEDIYTIHRSLSEVFNQKYDYLFSYLRSYGELMYGIDELKTNNLLKARKLLLKSIKTKWNYTKAQYYYLFLSFLPRSIQQLLIK